jgi:uncharacterized tellurite resistance protein B-like protein
MDDTHNAEQTPEGRTLADTARRLVLQFSETPGLSLTLPQACRLIHVDCSLCRAALEHLLSVGWLTKAADGQFRRTATVEVESSAARWYVNASEKPSRRTLLTQLSPREAFAAILIAAARSDGTVSSVEAARLEQLLASMRLYRDCDAAAVRPLVRELIDVLTAEGDPLVVHAAAAAIPVHLRASVMALAADIILSDGRVRNAEQQFLDDLEHQLSLDASTARTIFDVMLIKNSA